MSLPASLTTDCGGLLNRRGPGRKCCCHTGLFTRDIMLFSSHGWFLSRIIELVYFHTEHRGRSRGVVTNYRIIEFLFTRSIAESHGFIVPNYRISFHTESHGESRDLCHELSNFFSHGRSRRFSLSQDMFLVTNLRDLSLDPLTNGR